MSRWNISSVFFLSVAGQRRSVEFRPDTMNIITGASGTGKSTLIKAIDYCLGSSKCELPAHVRRRSLAVGVKWIADSSEMIVGRVVPPVGQDTSTRMFVTSGKSLPLPTVVDDFIGATTVDAAKAFLERAFGIGDMRSEPDSAGNIRGRATVRNATPYLFVTKEVIYSESVLLHGLERADHARDIVATMPYFLRAVDEATPVDEYRLRTLHRALEREENVQRSKDKAGSVLKERAISLLVEANRVGISPQSREEASEEELLDLLRGVLRTELEATSYPSEDEISTLHQRRRDVLRTLTDVRQRSHAARVAVQEATGFQGATARQREKLSLGEHLGVDAMSETCPICESPSERGKNLALAIHTTLSKIRAESVAVDRVKPRLLEHERLLLEQIESQSSELRRIDDQIRTWLRQSDETKRLADLAQVRARLLGRISFFLETSTDDLRQVPRDLGVLRAEIAELEARLDREAKETRLRRAEAKVSQYATEAFRQLPTVAPCVGAELDFSARRPDVKVIEAESGAVLRLSDVGSDQNYLAVHIALSFALQRHFEVARSPVPGLLVLDQISRPYFPTKGEDDDEQEVDGDREDEDLQAMRRHIDFLFAETARRAGLQVILIEHAYFADDPRYVGATRERWNRASGRALIPLDWQTREDA